MNKVILSGYVTSDANIQQSSKGIDYAIFNIGVRNGKKDQVESFFIKCTCFGKDFIEKVIRPLCTKGARILVCGKLVIENYTTRAGTKETASSIIVESVESYRQGNPQNIVPVENEDEPF